MAFALSPAVGRSTNRLPMLEAQGTPIARMIDELVIDLAAEPPTLDPALVYRANAWSVVHSVYDSLVQYGRNGEIEYLLAESMR